MQKSISGNTEQTTTKKKQKINPVNLKQETEATVCTELRIVQQKIGKALLGFMRLNF